MENYRFILGKVFAIAMIAMGLHIVKAYLSKMLPFGIVSSDMGLWLIWGYTGWLIGGMLVSCGIMKLFELTINKWLSNF